MGILWSAGTTQDPAQPASVTALANAASFAPGDFIDSANTLYRLQFQTDGNLVLLELPDTVLFATGTEGLGATECIMQVDGNLVIYAGATPLWASNTAGHEGEAATLVLYDSGDLAVFSPEVENIAIWSIPPDWRTGATENLSWLSSVTESPLAVEQRMGLRLSPRQSFDFNFTVRRGNRTYFDLLTMRAGGSPIYVPLWHEIEKLALPVIAGGTALVFPTNFTEFQTAKFAFLQGPTIHDFELVEIQSYTSAGITLAAGLKNDWPQGAKIYPVKKCKMESQPNAERRADRAFQASIRFLSLEPNKTTAVPEVNYFMDHPVIEIDPNEAESLTYTYNRKMVNLDNQTGLQDLYDIAPFINQSFSWYAKGREAASKLRGLFYLLQGRRVPAWISSVYSDFELVATIPVDEVSMDVRRCGYTDAGGPFPNREFIVFQLESGLRYYRRIQAAALIGGGSTERITFDTPLPLEVTPSMVRRISFLSFCRLDQDSIELTHHTDTKGLTTVNTVFRTDPGIGGVENWLQIEVDPIPPGPGVIDPFKIPDQVLVGFNPFGSLGVAEPPAPDPTTYSFINWQEFLTEAETGFPNDLIVSNVGNNEFSLPLTGSFRVSLASWFDFDFGIPNVLKFRVVFFNTTLDPIETQIAINDIGDTDIFYVGTGNRYRTTSSLKIPLTERKRIIDVVVDPNQPIRIQSQFITAGWAADTGGPILGMNIFATADVDSTPDPYHEGDAFFKIEWWS